MLCRSCLALVGRKAPPATHAIAPALSQLLPLPSRTVTPSGTQRRLSHGSRRKRYMLDVIRGNIPAKMKAEPTAEQGDRLNEPLIATAPQDVLSEETMHWYNDPYKLGEYVRKQMQKSDTDDMRMYELVKRHKGAGNDVVWSTLIKALGKRGNLRLALHCFRTMKNRHMIPTPQCYTSVLHSIAVAMGKPSTDTQKKVELLNNASGIWREIKVPNIIHVNTMLRICRAACNSGGWEVASALVQQLIPKDLPIKTLKPELRGKLVPDATTFTILLGLCAARGGLESGTTAIQIWEQIKEILEHSQKGGVYASFAVDSPLLRSMLVACIRSGTKEHAEYALHLCKEWLALPVEVGVSKNDSTPVDIQQARLPLSTPFLSIIMQVAAALQNPGLALYWFDFVTKTQNVIADAECYRVLIMMLISEGDFDSAWKFAASGEPKKVEYTLWVVTTALHKRAAPSQLWLQRAQAIAQDASQLLLRQKDDSVIVTGEVTNMSRRSDILDIRSIVNVIEVLAATDAHLEAWEVLKNEKHRLLTVTQNILRSRSTKGGATSSDDLLSATPVTANKRRSDDMRARVRALNLGVTVCAEVLKLRLDEDTRREVELFQKEVRELLTQKSGVQAKPQRNRGKQMEQQRQIDL
ncbi:hypothetical protein HDU85_007130 [Gaertneriomyces sp. JEL0708]|nr:hypothetical protein HDU85_007130 [Gaertneriomyces sp. JEL0708]